MKTRTLLFSLILFICSNLSLTANAQVDANDSLALVALYKSTNGPSWKRHTNWLTGPVTTWYGITVSGNRVSEVSIEANNLTGVLPIKLSSLTALNTLDLSYNSLTGVIPPSLGNLIELRVIRFGTNQLTGPIPSSFSQLVNLTTLELFYNQLTGVIPKWLTTLTNLQILMLDNNQFTGTIPENFDNLTNCQWLTMSDNQLTGRIPNSVANLTHLQYLYFDGNKLTGQVPNIALIIKNNPQMNIIRFNNNHLTNVYRKTVPKNNQINVFISDNDFTFTGIEELINSGAYVVYYSQSPVKLQTNGNELFVSAGGTLTNNTYNWYKVGKPSPTTIIGDSTFVPAQSGQYYATVTNLIATGLTLTTDTLSYTAALQKPLSVSIYPNPVRGILTINGLDAKSNCIITLADVSGNVQMNTVTKQQSTVKYDVSRLKPGNYVLSVSNGQEMKTLNFMKE